MSWHIGTGLEQHGHAAGVANNSPVGCCLVRGFQRLGMSTKKAPPAGAPFAEPRFMQYRTGTMYVRAIRKKTKAVYHRGDGILPFVLYGVFWGNRCVRRKKGQALTYRGVLSLESMVYSAQQIGICGGKYDSTCR